MRGAAAPGPARGSGTPAAHIEDVTSLPNDHPATQYSQKPQDDPIARLQKRLDSGEVKLDYSDRWSWYPALLKYFGINLDSQVLVFSKTSFQLPKISPRTPRALYFNDEVSVGYVQGGDVLELWAGRRLPSRHNTSAPDMIFSAFRGG